jgi:hypothetical protein
MLISYECMHCYSIKIIGEILAKISVFFGDISLSCTNMVMTELKTKYSGKLSRAGAHTCGCFLYFYGVVLI